MHKKMTLQQMKQYYVVFNGKETILPCENLAEVRKYIKDNNINDGTIVLKVYDIISSYSIPIEELNDLSKFEL